ncbi:1-acylglycerol-3-phosphate O-acyltransferase [Malaciobacter marinus]|uniref:1-acyl-sn-glycerol-3-phosphate acyltransferase n=1 Tax=Malaciobacter marinus TaxID=505249 RepID=A0A347THI5_9BACT|nr:MULTISPECIES: lysophospholipid acyltransferase family protein [Malaciobacter]AXX86063.1 1-acylglycerol-3-phosphate O-acyltransferase [Malaciobacter marinus]PHO11737.1 1-acyl-sn-glycerol-3-phosphate acyltransferase [Malaciobacter marinus]PHO14352.1 1-acyl-sn-glycerol-3-phosphate acyltransferase [Malaciobacter marinus]RYA24030.1 1-acyl-sn-glycerol-3-phosphate acyltransferase [Malaciobacter halophilus]
MSRIRALLVVIQFSLTVAVTIFFMYLFRNHTHKVIKIWMKFQMFFLGIKLEEEGSLDETCDMVILNHQSLLDIIVMEYIHSKNLAWVAKKEITDLPFFGHIIKAPRMISIDRENKAGLVKLLRESKDRLSKGRPIAIFPEGTRTDGKTILPFKSGAKMVANKLKLRVQPVVMLNTRKILDSKKLTCNPGIVKVIYLEPVQASNDTDWFKQTELKMNEILKEKSKNEF